ncbi:AAA family ATPase [Metasolibacillus meyeri]|uniref:AAA family ATPase n=1 Tax=Metasolibacillus meyeri TaxID=1071052 RepID=A0AAW9NTY9_9BACL|nr:AAA family ATPase [Metasolibacillus meyeri]MEC1178263.1 AAA family ATPase [Metasolibacillus meyeri]
MYLRTLRYLQAQVPCKEQYPFNISAFEHFQELHLPTNITFFVGENGSGKSTLLEAIAYECGFHTAGGSRNHLYDVHESHSALGEYIRLIWSRKVARGFFLRAETFYQFASHLDLMFDPSGRKYDAYGGKSLHEQSHGESFLSLFKNAFGHKAIYLLDEPEAALSPTRQLSLMRIIKELEHDAQFIIATHSPILLGYPNATIYDFDQQISEVRYEETLHYILTKRFLDAKDKVLDELFLDLP